MLDQEASKTALGVAYIRAAHQLLDTPPLLFEDRVALALLGPHAEARIRSAAARYQNPFGRGLRSHVCLRSRFSEDRLQRAKADRYVLVGAGFDTFALRQPEWARSLKILEIDHPATQALKREKIAAAGFTLADNVHLVPCDFGRETLADALGRESIAAEETVFFSWLGVTMYLSEAAIDASLAAMAEVSNRAAVSLTFKLPDERLADKAMGVLVAAMGEAFVSFFTPEEMAAKLAAHRFLMQEFLDCERALAEYFTPPRPGLLPPRRSGIVYATTGR